MNVRVKLRIQWQRENIAEYKMRASVGSRVAFRVFFGVPVSRSARLPLGFSGRKNILPRIRLGLRLGQFVLGVRVRVEWHKRYIPKYKVRGKVRAKW